MENAFNQWFDDLPARHRLEAMATRGPLPEWMIRTMHDAGVVTVGAQIPARSVQLMTVQMRDFLDLKLSEHLDRSLVRSTSAASQH